MKWFIVALFCMGSFAYYLISVRGNAFRAIPQKNSEVCEKISELPGVEDIVALEYEGTPYFLMSSNLWLANAKDVQGGGLYLVRADDPGAEMKNLTKDFSGIFHPHGIDLLKQESSAVVAVVNHASPGTSQIELFQLNRDNLTYLNTVREREISDANDIALVTDNTFFLTVDHGDGMKAQRMLEDYFGIGHAKLLFFDGQSFRTLVSDLAFANGVAFDKTLGQIIVAEMLRNQLIVYKWDGREATESHRIPLPASPDNITINSDGSIFVAAHAKTFQLKLMSRGFPILAPSQLYRITNWQNKGFEVELVFSDVGKKFSSASVGVKILNVLALGSIFDRGYLRCVWPQ